MLRRRMLSQMPLPPSGNVNDAYFYVEAPWIKDLSKYNMNVDESMYMDIDKYNGKYVFSMEPTIPISNLIMTRIYYHALNQITKYP